MKTMHHDQYWSAHPRENRHPFEVDGQEYLDHNRFHNNMFCLFPERTVEFVSRQKVPVMGYKVLAAGAIEPKDGFKWAFDNGADPPGSTNNLSGSLLLCPHPQPFPPK